VVMKSFGGTSGTNLRTTRRNIPEDDTLQVRTCSTDKSIYEYTHCRRSVHRILSLNPVNGQFSAVHILTDHSPILILSALRTDH
jgi:hypothetical protein